MINTEASICPICNVMLKSLTERKNESTMPIKLNDHDKEFLSKLLDMKKNKETPAPENPEDVQERERAMKVLKSIALGESEEVAEERIKRIEGATGEREDIQKLRKELVKLGKPFESILERNLMNITLIEKELEDKKDELKGLESEKGRDIQDKRTKLEKVINELQKKRNAMKSYESNILSLGGAFRKLLGSQQSELFRWESDLKKRVLAFQKEVGMRRKQKEKLKKREDALDKREEELSHRFLDLKSRENEIMARQNKLIKRMEELKTKEEELKIWEAEIEASRNAEARMTLGKEGDKNFNREDWLKEQRKLQADLFKIRGEEIGSRNSKEAVDRMNEEFQNIKNRLQEREKELKMLKNDLKRSNSVIIEKDREIEKLKGSEPESTLDEDTRKLLKILDDLLERLPEDVVDKFARSDDYLLYEKVLEKFKL